MDGGADDFREKSALLDCLEWRDQILVWVWLRCRQTYAATFLQRLQGHVCPHCQNQ